MFVIRSHHVEAFEETWLEDFVSRLIVELRGKYSNAVPDSDDLLRESIIGWINDARIWGLHHEKPIARYVESCARFQGHRLSLEERLQTYLELYHENLVIGVELQPFVQSVLSLAARYGICADEGITWLAVVLLAQKRCLDRDDRWLHTILQDTGKHEEQRLLDVHEKAIARGWILR